MGLYNISALCLLLFVSQPEAGEYQYSGMHDAGPLVAPREGGTMARLIASVALAKEYNDTYLTQIIETEKARRAGVKQKSSSPSKKKAKTVSAEETP